MWTIPASRSKNKRQHALPLSDLSVELIKEQIAEVRDAATQRDHRLARRIARVTRGASAEIDAAAGPAWVFPGPGLRGPITVFAVAKAIERSLDHFGVDPFTSHDLRRTAATRRGRLAHAGRPGAAPRQGQQAALPARPNHR